MKWKNVSGELVVLVSVSPATGLWDFLRDDKDLPVPDVLNLALNFAGAATGVELTINSLSTWHCEPGEYRGLPNNTVNVEMGCDEREITGVFLPDGSPLSGLSLDELHDFFEAELYAVELPAQSDVDMSD